MKAAAGRALRPAVRLEALDLPFDIGFGTSAQHLAPLGSKSWTRWWLFEETPELAGQDFSADRGARQRAARCQAGEFGRVVRLEKHDRRIFTLVPAPPGSAAAVPPQIYSRVDNAYRMEKHAACCGSAS